MSIATRIQSMEEHISDAYDSLSKFGIAADNKNIENIAGLIDEIYNNSPKTDYISGTDLTFENTRVGKIDFKDTDNIEKIGLGVTSQDSEPTPDSPQDINMVKGNNIIKINNKNLLKLKNETKIVNGTTIKISDTGTIELSGTSSEGIQNTQIPENFYLDAGTYTIKTSVTGTSTKPQAFVLYNGSTVLCNIVYNANNDKATFTLSEKTQVTKISFWISAETVNTNLKSQIQLEKGDTATTYIAHQEDNYEISLDTIELCKINTYQDYIYKNNGNWYLHKEIGKVVLNGSETPTINTALTNTTRALYRNILPYNAKAGEGSGICNLLPYYANWVTDVEGFYLDNNTTNLVFRINKSTVGTTITSVNNFLSENNMTVYYILETPINIEITDTTLISQLDAWYNAQSMNDITYITVDGDLPMQLKLRALKK